MANKEKWVYRNGKLVEKVTIKPKSDGSTEIVRQKAFTDILGGRRPTKIISRTRVTK